MKMIPLWFPHGDDSVTLEQIRPDHGRMIWGERARPGYGLCDRAIGASYLPGLWEAVEKPTPRLK